MILRLSVTSTCKDCTDLECIRVAFFKFKARSAILESKATALRDSCGESVKTLSRQGAKSYRLFRNLAIGWISRDHEAPYIMLTHQRSYSGCSCMHYPIGPLLQSDGGLSGN